MLTGLVDLHVHAGPSLWPRRYQDPEALRVAREAGVRVLVLKAHEGSTVERARLLGEGAVGGVVLNAPAGGANPDAVRVAAGLGGRVVWMPTLSAPAHIASAHSTELSVHHALSFTEVPVCQAGALRPEWLPVLDEVARHDLVLASGHVSMDEAVILFAAAVGRGVRRLLVNHPRLPFLGWRGEHRETFRRLEARIEIGVLADHLSADSTQPTEYYLKSYPAELLVFGSDLGHQDFPEYRSGVRAWIERYSAVAGEARLERILTRNGEELLFS